MENKLAKISVSRMPFLERTWRIIQSTFRDIVLMEATKHLQHIYVHWFTEMERAPTNMSLTFILEQLYELEVIEVIADLRGLEFHMILHDPFGAQEPRNVTTDSKNEKIDKQKKHNSLSITHFCCSWGGLFLSAQSTRKCDVEIPHRNCRK